MKKYVCTICGYVYDEANEEVKFADLPDDWVCPLCGAPKSAFEEQKEIEDIKSEEISKQIINDKVEEDDKDIRKLSNEELSAILSNLSKASEKQYLFRESELFKDLADYYDQKVELTKETEIVNLVEMLNKDLDNFKVTMDDARERNDRGSLRSLTWSEKVTKILKSIISRYNKDGIDFIKKNNIYVCDICGFVFIGEKAPEVCPVCKVPSLKIIKMERE